MKNNKRRNPIVRIHSKNIRVTRRLYQKAAEVKAKKIIAINVENITVEENGRFIIVISDDKSLTEQLLIENKLNLAEKNKSSPVINWIKETAKFFFKELLKASTSAGFKKLAEYFLN